MKYSKEFVNLVNSDIKDYIGLGNPNAKILIVGKESAIEETNTQQKNHEINENVTQWRNNIIDAGDISDVQSLNFDESDINYPYNPLYPYKRQEYKVRTERNPKSRGTSKTWYQYQKLWDLITFGKEDIHSGFINFHEHCFSTELSTATEKNSLLVNDAKRCSSINRRKQLLTHPFFQLFPIVILAVGHYPSKYNIDLQSIFNTKRVGEDTVGRFWYNIYYSTNNKPKLLIHTNQFSMVSNKLIKVIAEKCRTFASENKIAL